jgi:LPXTG-motif cell wall-anchored protein
MDGVTTIRVVAGILALLVLGIIIWRRRRKAIE